MWRLCAAGQARIPDRSMWPASTAEPRTKIFVAAALSVSPNLDQIIASTIVRLALHASLLLSLRVCRRGARGVEDGGADDMSNTKTEQDQGYQPACSHRSNLSNCSGTHRQINAFQCIRCRGTCGQVVFEIIDEKMSVAMNDTDGLVTTRSMRRCHQRRTRQLWWTRSWHLGRRDDPINHHWKSRMSCRGNSPPEDF